MEHYIGHIIHDRPCRHVSILKDGNGVAIQSEIEDKMIVLDAKPDTQSSLEFRLKRREITINSRSTPATSFYMIEITWSSMRSVMT